MRKNQAAKEQSELRRLSQARFHLLVLEHENICDLDLPNCADAFLYAREHYTHTTLVTEKTDGCSVVNTFIF